jgi:UV DNA damage endonuclease
MATRYNAGCAFFKFKKKNEDTLTTPTAHADYVYEKVNIYRRSVDIMFEAKAKELAVIKYVKGIAKS